jgi:RNA polymerase sigma-70 factor, ECF subfamily
MIASCPVARSEPPSLDRMLAGAEAAFRAALTDSFHGLELCDRNVLRFHYFHGLTVDQLAEVLCSHRAAVVRQLARIRERLLRETRRNLAGRLPLDKHQLDRLLEVARSRVDLAITRILRSSATTSASR